VTLTQCAGGTFAVTCPPTSNSSNGVNKRLALGLGLGFGIPVCIVLAIVIYRSKMLEDQGHQQEIAEGDEIQLSAIEKKRETKPSESTADNDGPPGLESPTKEEEIDGPPGLESPTKGEEIDFLNDGSPSASVHRLNTVQEV